MSDIGTLIDETLARIEYEDAQMQILEPGSDIVVGSALWHECKAWKNRYWAARSRLSKLPQSIFDRMAEAHLDMAANVLKQTPAPLHTSTKRTARRTP